MDLKKILTEPFVKAILSNKRDKSFAYNKAVVEPITLKNKPAWQLTLYTDKQAFQENLKTADELFRRVEELFQNHYKQLNLFGVEQDSEIKISKRGKLMESHHKHAPVCTTPTSHNRQKNYIIAEGQKIPALVDMGA